MKSVVWSQRLLALFVGLVVIFSTFPLIIILPVSVNEKPRLSIPDEGITLDWYAKALEDRDFVDGFITSVSVSTAATVVALVVGSLVAWALSQPSFPGRRLVELYFLSPLILARVVYGVAMLIVLTRIDLIRTIPGLIIAHSVIVTPYVVRVVGASLVNLSPSIEEAARILGARQVEVLWHITLPMIRPGLIAASVFAFITSFDEYTMTAFLVGPRVSTLPIEIFRYIELIVDPTVAAVSVIMILFSIIVIAIVERTLGLEAVL